MISKIKQYITHVIIGILIVGLISSTVVASHFQKKFLKADTNLKRITNELRIEKDNVKIVTNLEEINELKNKLAAKDKKLLILYSKLEDLRTISNTRTAIMEELHDIEDTQSACAAFVRIGYPICGK